MKVWLSAWRLHCSASSIMLHFTLVCCESSSNEMALSAKTQCSRKYYTYASHSKTLLYVVVHVFHHFIVCFFPWVESLRFVAILRSRAELPSSWRLSLQRNSSRLCQNILLRAWAWAHHWQGFRFWTLKPASESGWAAGSNLSSVRSAPSSRSALSPGRYF